MPKKGGSVVRFAVISFYYGSGDFDSVETRSGNSESFDFCNIRLDMK